MDKFKVQEELLEVLEASQISGGCHQKNCMLLRKIYEQAGVELFWAELEKPLRVILRTNIKSNVYYNRITDFLGKFCGVLSRSVQKEGANIAEHPLITKIFKYLLKQSSYYLDNVRIRSCQLINKFTEHLIDCEVSDEFWNDIQEMLQDRLTDDKGIIRAQAILALYRFQNVDDPDDPLISKFIDLLYDNQIKIRQLSTEKIAVNRETLDHIIKRTRDVDSKVRLIAFKKVSTLIKAVKLSDRRTIIWNGINDQSDKVKEYIFHDFLNTWWECYNQNIIKMLKSCRMDADEKDIELTNSLYEFILNGFFFKRKTANQIIEALTLTSEKFVPVEELNWETAAYWKMVISLCYSRDSLLEPYEEQIVPEIVFFTQYIKSFVEDCLKSNGERYLEEQYILKQLFSILNKLDMTDPHSIRSVKSLIQFVLKNGCLMDDVVEVVIGTVNKFLKPEEMCSFGLEIISDLQYPIDDVAEAANQRERDFMLSQLKVTLNQLKEEKNEAIQATNYLEAERLKNEIVNVQIQINEFEIFKSEEAEREPVKRTDYQTNIKCLDIAWAILRLLAVHVKHLTPGLMFLKNEFLPSFLCDNNEMVKMKALRCFACCCVYDKTTARHGIHLFAVPISAYQADEECYIPTLITCVEAISDLLLVHGEGLLAEPVTDQLNETTDEDHEKIFTGGTSLTSLVQGLVELMDDEDSELQLKACVGLCKLLLGERIYSHSIVTRLILKWCNPVDDENQDLKQYIGFVLEKLPFLPNGLDQLEKAILLVVSTIAEAPKTSPLAKVDMENVSKFMAALCKLSPKKETIQTNLAIGLCRKVQCKPDDKINGIYTKLLLMLDVPEDRTVLEELFALAEEIREYSRDSTTTKNFTKYLSTLSLILGEFKNVTVLDEEAPISSDSENEVEYED